MSSLYAKGPSYISNIFQCIITWRSWVLAGAYDISKAYHMMLTTIKEFFTRLVVFFDPESGELTTWGHLVVGFGDISASVFLELSKQLMAEMGVSIDPELCRQLVYLSYVDDGLFD